MLCIALDGVDRCYKTTTLKLLQKKIKLLFQKDVAVYKAANFSAMFQSQVKDNQSEFFLNRLRHSTLTELDMQEQIKFDVIYDRHYPSEFVYSRYYQRPSDETLLRTIDEKFKTLGGKIILLRRHDYAGWTDDLDVSIDLRRIDQLYEEFENWTCNKIHTIFVDDETFKEPNARVNQILVSIYGEDMLWNNFEDSWRSIK